MTRRGAANGLQDRRASVTGATSGIGRAIAHRLARDGSEVPVHGRDAARGAETVAEIVADGGKARQSGAAAPRLRHGRHDAV
jgi:NAD(P)-dependent dehydrogenase (short-subunit alcohol dehydrogenase family)